MNSFPASGAVVPYEQQFAPDGSLVSADAMFNLMTSPQFTAENLQNASAHFRGAFNQVASQAQASASAVEQLRGALVAVEGRSLQQIEAANAQLRVTGLESENLLKGMVESAKASLQATLNGIKEEASAAIYAVDSSRQRDKAEITRRLGSVEADLEASSSAAALQMRRLETNTNNLVGESSFSVEKKIAEVGTKMQREINDVSIALNSTRNTLEIKVKKVEASVANFIAKVDDSFKRADETTQGVAASFREEATHISRKYDTLALSMAKANSDVRDIKTTTGDLTSTHAVLCTKISSLEAACIKNAREISELVGSNFEDQDKLNSVSLEVSETKKKIGSLIANQSLLNQKLLSGESESPEVAIALERLGAEMKEESKRLRELVEKERKLAKESSERRDLSLSQRIDLLSSQLAQSRHEEGEWKQRALVSEETLRKLIVRVTALEAKQTDRAFSPAPYGETESVLKVDFETKEQKKLATKSYGSPLRVEQDFQRYKKGDFDLEVEGATLKDSIPQTLKNVKTRKWLDTSTKDVIVFPEGQMFGLMELPSPYAFPHSEEDSFLFRVVGEVGEVFVSPLSDEELLEELLQIRKDAKLVKNEFHDLCMGDRQTKVELFVALQQTGARGQPVKALNLLRRARTRSGPTSYSNFLAQAEGRSEVKVNGLATVFSSFEAALTPSGGDLKSVLPEARGFNARGRGARGRGGRGGVAAGVNDADREGKNSVQR